MSDKGSFCRLVSRSFWANLICRRNEPLSDTQLETMGGPCDPRVRKKKETLLVLLHWGNNARVDAQFHELQNEVRRHSVNFKSQRAFGESDSFLNLRGSVLSVSDSFHLFLCKRSKQYMCVCIDSTCGTYLHTSGATRACASNECCKNKSLLYIVVQDTKLGFEVPKFPLDVRNVHTIHSTHAALEGAP